MNKIIPNPDREKYENVTQAVKDNEGYCPCKTFKTPENKCMCHEFIEGINNGTVKPGDYCHCGRYKCITI